MEVSALEYPELNFLVFLLDRFVEETDVDIKKATVSELYDKLNEEMTPIGGG